jgi:putative transposase
MIKTYTYKIKPNKALERKFEEQVSIVRYVYNTAKECREESFKKGVNINYFDLSKQLTDAKKEFDWLKKVHSQTLQATLERLEAGYKKFFSDLKRGVKTSKPKWAKKDKWKSLPFKSVKTTFNGFKLPSFGSVKVFNFKVPKGELRTANIIKEADGLYLKIVVREEGIVQERENQSVCAIDMGVKFFYVTSDGEFVDNPKHLFQYLKELRVENRKLSRMKKGGKNFKKQVNVLQRLYQKVSRVRKDFLHKRSRYLADNYSTVIREDLEISKMAKGNLAKHILDCSWGLFFELLEYKTTVLKVNPAYSSQACSKCNHTTKENRKTQSLFECVKCGHTDNADFQATQNLLQWGQTLMEANVGQ